ncbi:hypothetical protein LX32DRAFT_238165 [Colletotrichum zoysiae]|uniref:Uncharacterized protein n=1 Tax=Colletotrichum zoysiae TaxID=1216348 RepID=A0AAD9M7Z0_9PEZI|nr:hypothetical protein LX32DRAFT_238165 [Colletotrichum zoysiae]
MIKSSAISRLFCAWRRGPDGTNRQTTSREEGGLSPGVPRSSPASSAIRTTTITIASLARPFNDSRHSLPVPYRTVPCCAVLCCAMCWALGSSWHGRYLRKRPLQIFCLILVPAAVLFLFPLAFISGPSLVGLAVASLSSSSSSSSLSTNPISLSHYLNTTNTCLDTRRAAGLELPRIGPLRFGPSTPPKYMYERGSGPERYAAQQNGQSTLLQARLSEGGPTWEESGGREWEALKHPGCSGFPSHFHRYWRSQPAHPIQDRLNPRKLGS